MSTLGQYTGAAAEYKTALGATALEALLHDLKQGIWSLINVQTPSLKLFRERELGWSGRRATVQLETGLNGSFSAVEEGGTLIAPDRTEHNECQIFQSYVYGQMAITHQAVQATKNSKGALAQVVKVETASLRKAFRHHLQRMFWNDGSGKLCKVSTYVGGLVTLDTTVTDAPTNTAHMLKRMKVAWGTEAQLKASANASDGYGYVSAVNSDGTCTVVTSSGNDPAALDYLVMGDANVTSYTDLTGTAAGQGFTKEFMGIKGMSSTTAKLQGLDPASYPWWVPSTINAGTKNVSQELLMGSVIKYMNENEGDLPDLIMGHTGMMLEIAKVLWPDQRFAPMQLKPGGNKMAYTFEDNVIPFLWDRMAARGELLFLEKKYFGYGWHFKPDWVTWNTGGKILKWVDGSDQATATYGGFGQFFTFDRTRLLRLYGLNMSTTYV